MPHIHLITVGRLKSGPLKDAYDDYAKRLTWRLTLTELDIRAGGTIKEQTAITAALTHHIPTIMMDERGKNITSTALAQTLQKHFDAGEGNIQIVIGGADGLSDDLRKRATHLISFGACTWPHMLARVMLVEQLYRAQQIIAGHPYHRA